MATLQNKAIDVCKLAGDVLSADECHCLPAIQVHPRHPNAAFVTRLDACAEPQVQQIGDLATAATVLRVGQRMLVSSNCPPEAFAW